MKRLWIYLLLETVIFAGLILSLGEEPTIAVFLAFALGCVTILLANQFGMIALVVDGQAMYRSFWSGDQPPAEDLQRVIEKAGKKIVRKVLS